MSLLHVEDLRIRFPGDSGMVEVVRGVSFALGREKVALVGESGSGKSLTGRSLLGLVPAPGLVSARRLEFDGIDLSSLDKRGWRRLRGRRLATILQDPRQALNPVMTVGAQVTESASLHLGLGAKAARLRALEMLEAVQLRDPERVFAAYPHQLSGGMGQRAMIAMMLLPEPDLLIADEPTSALDASVRLSVMAMLQDLVERRGMALLFISHDLELVRRFCDRVLVMYGGRILESLPAAQLEQASHPYTRALLNARPRLDGPIRTELPVMRRDPAWLMEES